MIFSRRMFMKSGATVVAAGLPAGEAVVREITGHGYDVAAL